MKFFKVTVTDEEGNLVDEGWVYSTTTDQFDRELEGCELFDQVVGLGMDIGMWDTVFEARQAAGVEL
jgi:hypothetical protein